MKSEIPLLRQGTSFLKLKLTLSLIFQWFEYAGPHSTLHNHKVIKEHPFY